MHALLLLFLFFKLKCLMVAHSSSVATIKVWVPLTIFGDLSCMPVVLQYIINLRNAFNF